MYSMALGGELMKKSDVNRVAIFIAVLAAFAGLSWILALVNDKPTRQEYCSQKCARNNMEGHLVYRGPATPKEAYRTENADCECR